MSNADDEVMPSLSIGDKNESMKVGVTRHSLASLRLTWVDSARAAQALHKMDLCPKKNVSPQRGELFFDFFEFSRQNLDRKSIR